MQEPRASIVGFPADGDVITCNSKGYDVTARRVDIVVCRLPGTPHDIKSVLSIKCQLYQV